MKTVRSLLSAAEYGIVCSCYIIPEISNVIHFLVRDADDINAVISYQVEDNMCTLWEAVIAFSYIRAVFTQLRIFR